MAETHLVLGAGAFARAAVRALREQGREVRVLCRRPADLGPGVDLRAGDVRSLGTVLDAAKGVASITHGAAPPLSQWKQDLGPMTDTVVEAAGLTGASLLMPGPNWSIRPIPGVPLPTTLFEPDALDQVIEPGRQRQWIEHQLSQLSETRNVRTLVVRSSDWFGRDVADNLLMRSLRSAKAGGSLSWFAPLDLPHDLVFVEDVARVAIGTLLDPARPPFDVVHVSGHLVDGPGLANAVGEVLGRKVPVRQVRDWELGLRALLDRELWAWRDTAAIWKAGLILDDRDTRARGFTPTPLVEALNRTLRDG